MDCRIGMAKKANARGRIDHWKKKEGHTDDEILHENKSYDEATELEKEEAEARGCVYHAGGDRDNDDDWCVYHVWGGKTS